MNSMLSSVDSAPQHLQMLRTCLTYRQWPRNLSAGAPWRHWVSHTVRQRTIGTKGCSFPRGRFASQTCGNATTTRRSMVTTRQNSILGDSWMSTEGWSQAQSLWRRMMMGTVLTGLGGGLVLVNTWPMRRCSSVWPRFSGPWSLNARAMKMGRRSHSMKCPSILDRCSTPISPSYPIWIWLWIFYLLMCPSRPAPYRCNAVPRFPEAPSLVAEQMELMKAWGAALVFCMR